MSLSLQVALRLGRPSIWSQARHCKCARPNIYDAGHVTESEEINIAADLLRLAGMC